MEELPKSVRFKKVSFKTQHQLPPYRNGKLEDTCHTGAHRIRKVNEIPPLSSSYQPLELAANPIHAMEFLSRSCSPFASDFLQMFTSKDQLSPLYENNRTGEHEETVEVDETGRYATKSNRSTVNRVDSIWEMFTTQRTGQSHLLMHKSPDRNRIDLKYLKKLLREKSLTSFLRWHKERNKEEVRLHKAHLHAALSVARLAAALTGFVANIIDEAQDIKHIVSEGAIPCDKNLGIVVATAAALIATVCAEAAESAGADKACVSSIVNTGLATQTTTDIIALTANAATCLRGAATLESRAMADAYSPKNQELLKLGAKLSLLKPSGRREHRWVAVYLKRKQLMLSIRMKYLGGVLTTSKEYVIEETKGTTGYNLLSLKTNSGDIKLLFEDEMQSIVWRTTISDLLQMRDSYLNHIFN